MCADAIANSTQALWEQVAQFIGKYKEEPKVVPAARPLRNRIYVLELYSGRGEVSAVASTVLDNCPVETLDMSTAYGQPTIEAKLPDDNKQVVEHLKQKYPGMRPVIWASPDCTHYSRARSNAILERDLDTADKGVHAVRQLGLALNALLTIIENPGTGLLVGRDVIRFMPYSFQVNYCQYGALYPKPTMLWCSHDLSATGFVPRLCNGTCDASFVASGMRRHVRNVCDFDRSIRISVPPALVACVFKSVRPLLDKIMPAIPEPHCVRAARNVESYEVDYISGVRVTDTGVQLRVAWVGYDVDDWIDARNLDAGIEEYGFIDNNVKDEVLEMMSAYSCQGDEVHYIA